MQWPSLWLSPPLSLLVVSDLLIIL